MSDILVTPKNSLRTAIREFLRNKSNELIHDQYCPHCGSLMAFAGAQFWLDEDREACEIPLPYCQHCHPEITTRISAAA
jgi:hypothetical protein